MNTEHKIMFVNKSDKASVDRCLCKDLRWIWREIKRKSSKASMNKEENERGKVSSALGKLFSLMTLEHKLMCGGGFAQILGLWGWKVLMAVNEMLVKGIRQKKLVNSILNTSNNGKLQRCLEKDKSKMVRGWPCTSKIVTIRNHVNTAQFSLIKFWHFLTSQTVLMFHFPLHET